jgi:hypothetical protein
MTGYDYKTIDKHLKIIKASKMFSESASRSGIWYAKPTTDNTAIVINGDVYGLEFDIFDSIFDGRAGGKPLSPSELLTLLDILAGTTQRQHMDCYSRVWLQQAITNLKTRGYIDRDRRQYQISTVAGLIKAIAEGLPEKPKIQDIVIGNTTPQNIKYLQPHDFIQHSLAMEQRE